MGQWHEIESGNEDGAIIGWAAIVTHEVGKGANEADGQRRSISL